MAFHKNKNEQLFGGISSMNKKIYYSIAIIITAMLALGSAAYSVVPNQDDAQKDNYRPIFLAENILPEKADEDESLAVKNETVYVLLDHDGTALDQRIVNRIYGQEIPGAGLVVDYGDYVSVENMITGDKPVTDHNRVIWDSELLENEDIYYEGTIQKQLPVDITIAYYLDGIEIQPENLAGKSGRLELLINFKNNLNYSEPLSYYDYEGNLVTKQDDNYVPLLVQGTLDADLNLYSEIDPGSGMSLIMGQTASINFMVFPYPEDEIRISMNGVDIELERISFMITPQMLTVPDVDIEDMLIQMLEGIRKFSEGFGELSDGADQILQGLIKFNDESKRLTSELDDLYTIIEEYKIQRENLLDILESSEIEELLSSIENLELLLAEIENIPDSSELTYDLDQAAAETEELGIQLNELDQIFSGLEKTSSQITVEAEKLINETEPGTPLHELGLLLKAREDELQRAFNQNDQTGQSFSALQNNLDSFRQNWLNNYIPGLKALEELDILLKATDINNRIETIGLEISKLNEYLEMVDQFILESDSMLADIKMLPEAFDRMVAGQSRLTEGINALGSGGIKAMEEGLIEGINESRAGKAKMELMEKLADDYRSYADNEHNRFSEVRFIIQTPRIEIKNIDSPDDVGNNKDSSEKWTEQILAKFISLFE